MQLGSDEHKAQFIKSIITEYYESQWSDELFNEKQRDDLGDKRKELAAINEKIDAKGFKSKNEGEKAKFVCEREIVHLEQEIAKIEGKIAHYWPMRIEKIKSFAEAQGIALE